MNEASGKSIRSIISKDWDVRWVRFRMALKIRGGEPRFQEYYRGWVLSFLSGIKPRSFSEANLEDVRVFLEGAEMRSVFKNQNAPNFPDVFDF